MKCLTQNRYNRYRAGFSLVEIVTVLFIVSLGLVGILSLIVQNIQSQSYNKDNLIAYQLAQEGIELIRKVRDSNWRGAKLPFNIILSPGQYRMDYNDLTPTHYSPGHPEQLILVQDANGFYSHDLAATVNTNGFSRLITIENGDDDSVKVTVRISWGTNNRNYTYDLATILYNWK